MASRIKNFLWGPVDEPYDEWYDDGTFPMDAEPEETYPPRDEEAPPRTPPRNRSAGRNDDLVELRPPRRPQTEIRYPRSFEDVQALADLYKSGAFLIVDLEHVEERDRGRLVHFLCGVAYGRDGKSHRINDLTFAFAPRHFEMEAQRQGQERERDDSAGFMPRFGQSA